MKAEDLTREFANRYVSYSGGLLLLSAADAVALVERAANEGLPVLGIDGISVSQGRTDSLVENIADFSSAVSAGKGCWEEAKAFIDVRRRGGLVFEVVLGEAHVLPNQPLQRT